MAKKVTFILSAEVAGEATSGLLLGEFNNWNHTDGIKLEKQKDGSLKAIASLQGGRAYEYRYFLNDGRWVNDQSAENYVYITDFYVENCVVNVPKETTEIKKTGSKENIVKVTVAPAKVPAKKIVSVKEKVINQKNVALKPVINKAAAKVPKVKPTKSTEK